MVFVDELEDPEKEVSLKRVIHLKQKNKYMASNVIFRKGRKLPSLRRITRGALSRSWKVPQKR